jgi:hypothetical protein
LFPKKKENKRKNQQTKQKKKQENKQKRNAIATIQFNRTNIAKHS